MNAAEKAKRLALLEKRSPDTSTSTVSVALSRVEQERACEHEDSIQLRKRKHEDGEHTDSGHASKIARRDDGDVQDGTGQGRSSTVNSGGLMRNEEAIATDQKPDIIQISDSDEDEENDVKHAIALSLQGKQSPGSSASVASHGNREQRNFEKLQFAEGVVLLTKADSFPATANHVSIEDLFERDHLRRAVLSAFQIDLEWVLSKLNVGRTAIHIACEAKTEEAKQTWHALCRAWPKVFPIFPPMQHANCMHSKLQLLFFDHHVRIVIPSANLVAYDWGEGGTMENILFVQDFPMKQIVTGGDDDTEDEVDITDPETDTNCPPSASPAPSFLRDLQYFLRRCEYPATIIDELEGYDFTRARDVRLVASTGGGNFGADVHKTGLLRLAQVVRSLPWLSDTTRKAVTIDYVTASIGALNAPFVQRFMNACRGITVPHPGDKTRVAKVVPDIRGILNIFFPTRSAVLQSRAGHAGTICFQSSYHARPDFPRDALVQHVAVRPGLLSHCKIILCRTRECERVGWAYVGSANFSASAWGDKRVQDRATKRDKFSCRNWECGVVVRLHMLQNKEPMERRKDKNTDPWYFMES